MKTFKELDSSGLYYYGARFYHPAIAHFTQPDPVIQNIFDPQNLNHYSYCRNNPLNLIDPTGMSFSSLWNSWGSSLSNTWNSISAFTQNTWQNFQRSINSLATEAIANFSFRETIGGFGSSIVKGVGIGLITAGVVGLGLAFAPVSITSSAAFGTTMGILNIAGQIIAGIGTGMSLGSAILGKDMFGNSLSWQQRGELLGGATLGIGAVALGSLESSKFYNYYNTNKSYQIGTGTWITPGTTGPPYGTDYIKAGNFLSNTHIDPWNDYRPVSLKWNQFVSGPRITAPKFINGSFAKGTGIEYRIGGFGNWGEYFRDWRTYFASQWGE